MKKGRNAMQSIRRIKRGEKCNQSEEPNGGEVQSAMQSIKRIKRGEETKL